MDDTLEMIRQQMTETKSHLSDKREHWEHQGSDTVQSTGTAVNDTVAAVQKTVDSVTGAVQGAVQSVSNAFDVRRQFDRHPWLVLGGAVVVGYLAYELLAGAGKKSEQSSESAPRLGPAKGNAGDNNGQPTIASYALDVKTGRYAAAAIDVLTLDGLLIKEHTAFVTPQIFARFGLPAEHAGAP
jgi:hypothetical protein